MHYSLSYGRGKLSLALPDELDVEVIEPLATPVAPDATATLSLALEQPLGERVLADFASARSVAIAINDKTRPVPHAVMLPPLLQRLERLGVPREAITLLIATGTHTPTPQQAFDEVVPPEVLSSYRVISHDCDAPDLARLGTTARGTPVYANPVFAEADVRIVTGNIEPHHFAGFSGGAKSAAIGLAGRATITANHKLLIDERSTLARYDDNPLRQDIEEIARLMRVDFALNVVMNHHKQITHAFAGDPQAVIRAGMPAVRATYEVPVAAPFDLVITSPGGHPKDINLYQAHKAVTAGYNVTKCGGSLILVAACEDGVGHTDYERWMLENAFPSQQAVLEQFERGPFKLGPHKAFLFARQAVQLRDLWVVSEIAPETMRALLLSPASLGGALAATLSALPSGARVGVIPYANATIPVLAKDA